MASLEIDRVTGLKANIAVKAPCLVATTANITLSGLQTIDGVVLAEDDRVLVKDQSTASQNGIYLASSGDWSRAPDMRETGDVTGGTQAFVLSGSTNPRTNWAVITTGDIIVETTSITWYPYLLTSINNSALANMAQGTIKGRAAGAGSGTPQDLTQSQARTVLGYPSASTDNAFVRFDGSLGGTQDSGVTADDNNNVTIPGRLKITNLPSFRANWNAAFTATIEITSVSEVFDNTANFNPTTGRFTAPQAGKYLFQYSTLNQNAAATGALAVAVNGSAIVQQRSAAANEQMSGSVILDLALSDFVSLYITTGVSLANSTFSSFSGSQLG